MRKINELFFQNLYSASNTTGVNPIQDGPFRGCSRMEGGAQKGLLPKICHTCPTTMKFDTPIPYIKKIQKIYKSRNTPL